MKRREFMIGTACSVALCAMPQVLHAATDAPNAPAGPVQPTGSWMQGSARTGCASAHHMQDAWNFSATSRYIP